MTQPHSETVRRVIDSGQAVARESGERLIRKSWLRCAREYGLQPEHNPGIRQVSAADLQQRRQRVGEYLDVARTGMDQLYGHIAGQGYITMLADSDGIALECRGGERADPALEAAGLRAGTVWDECTVGTNGIGTCIAEQKTLTCHRTDHFYAGHLDLSCTAAPLHDPHGRVAAVLDISALSVPGAREGQQLARHLTSLYARLIEDSFFSHHFRDHWLLRLGRSAAFVDNHADLILALDEDGMIVGANTGARRQLQPPTGQTPVGHGIGAFFRDGNAQVHSLKHDRDGVRLHSWAHDSFHAALSKPRRPRRVHARCAPAATGALQAMADDDSRMQRLIARAERLASKPIDLLIEGETGTGKEVLARALHASSHRSSAPFVAINCAALPESLIESELFGYAPGTFTGARQQGMKGLLQQAHGGTLFLDEIGDMPIALQTRLLRVLAEREVLPLGSDTPIALDVRVITATHRDLAAAVAAGAFRQDLYYRLAGGTLSLPALRDRSDVDWLIGRLLEREAETLGCRARIQRGARERLLAHDWPGNIRELRNVLRFALALADDDGIDISDLPAALASAMPARLPSVADKHGDPEPGETPRKRLLAHLQQRRWNIAAVARDLDVARSTVYRRMARLHIVDPKNQS
ncbi:sigma-54-dependent Fis family transcriptional regulator [Salinisphaera sp.]|uniref:sigma-54-dependent Fis family transcriptional regulator n=1 Tax=Salinisphaera sp. TaxID=1914330 RepID=UPI000C6A7591|nr:sigma-54-dependent Fis family transcriptional regulator [Salinisphaera sp.]MBS64356.1 AAA family ATPase [Salinisphaera sp.]